MKALTFVAGALVALVLAVLFPQPANAQSAGPSQQIVTVTGNDDLTGTAKVQAGTTRIWAIRYDGDGVLSPRAIEGFRLVAAEEDMLAFESAASNSAPIAETVEMTIGVHHDKWSTTRILIKAEVGGRTADEDAGRNPWVAAKMWANGLISSGPKGTVGGLGLSAVKPLGGAWVGSVDFDSTFEGSARSMSSLSGSDWASYRFGFAFGQNRPYGTRWSLGTGVDFGEYGIGANRPLYLKADLNRTALPGQPWETQLSALSTVGSAGAALGVNAGWDFRLWGPVTVGLAADGNVNPNGSHHLALGPSFGLNIPAGGYTVRTRSGAQLGFAKDTAGATTGTIAPFLQVGLQKGN